MPGKIDTAPTFSGGTPETSTVAALAAGSGGPFLPQRELGKVYNAPDARRWQKVQFNSTLTHAAAVKEVVYWVLSKFGYMVDTDFTDSAAGLNSVAGCLITGHTLPVANSYAWILQEGQSITLTGNTGTNFTASDVIIASATVGQINAVADATAPTSQKLGTVHTAVDRSGGAGDVVCDIDIESKLY